MFDKNARIQEMLEDTLNSHNKIWVITDWHMVRYDKQTTKVYNRKDYLQILLQANRIIGKDDMVINLGDTVDSEIEDKRRIKDIIQRYHGKYKVMTIGNNDSFEPEFYESCGIDCCVYAFTWHDIVFTHCPIPNQSRYNVHGHLHVGDPDWTLSWYWRQYDIKRKNHINAFNPKRAPVDLLPLINAGTNWEVLDPIGDVPKPKPLVVDLLNKTLAEYNEIK